MGTHETPWGPMGLGLGLRLRFSRDFAEIRESSWELVRTPHGRVRVIYCGKSKSCRKFHGGNPAESFTEGIRADSSGIPGGNTREPMESRGIPREHTGTRGNPRGPLRSPAGRRWMPRWDPLASHHTLPGARGTHGSSHGISP